MSPWLIKEKTGIQFYVTNPFWNNPDLMDKLFITTGILDFKYQCATHVNSFIKKQNANILIQAGTPLVHMIPITEKKVKVKCHTVTAQEHKEIWDEHKREFWFTQTYNKFKKAFESKK